MKVKDTSEIKRVDVARPSDPARSTAAREATAPDKVSTEESARLEAALATVQQGLGASRSARLQAIETAVRQGTLTPNPQRIAQQILDDAELAAALQAMLER